MAIQSTLGRRHLLAGAGAAALAGATLTRPAAAKEQVPKAAPMSPKGASMPAMMSAPKPIPGSVDSGDPNVGLIHWWLPGPTDATTQILEIPGFGLDVDPSTITDFKGYSALAVVAGKVKGSDGVRYDCEFDVRAMKGNYIAEDGKRRHGEFAFV